MNKYDIRLTQPDEGGCNEKVLKPSTDSSRSWYEPCKATLVHTFEVASFKVRLCDCHLKEFAMALKAYLKW